MPRVQKDATEFAELIIKAISAGIKIGEALVFPQGHSIQKALINKPRSKEIVKRTIKRLVNQKVLAWENKNGLTTLVLLEKGRKKILEYDLRKMSLKKTSWDGLFRVIIFDIPESKKVAREALRKKLKELDFQQLQKSVFVSPYECRDEIDFLKNAYNVSSHVSYILASEIPDITFNIPISRKK